MKHTQIEYFSINGHKIRLSPGGLYVYSKDFLNSYKSLPKAEVPFSPSRYYLVLRSIELSLKAFLSCNGYSLNKLSERSLGHNLKALLNECEVHDLKQIKGLNKEHKDEIRAASEYYSDKVFEYPASGEAVNAYPKTPELSILAEAANVLVKYNREPCLKAKN